LLIHREDIILNISYNYTDDFYKLGFIIFCHNEMSLNIDIYTPVVCRNSSSEVLIIKQIEYLNLAVNVKQLTRVVVVLILMIVGSEHNESCSFINRIILIVCMWYHKIINVMYL